MQPISSFRKYCLSLLGTHCDSCDIGSVVCGEGFVGGQLFQPGDGLLAVVRGECLGGRDGRQGSRGVVLTYREETTEYEEDTGRHQGEGAYPGEEVVEAYFDATD